MPMRWRAMPRCARRPAWCRSWNRKGWPAAVPGIVFLSGGQGAEYATDHLNAMNAMGPQPWEVSFSYGRALQAPVLAAWQGQEDNVAAPPKALFDRCPLDRPA